MNTEQLNITNKLNGIFQSWQLPEDSEDDIMYALYEAFMCGASAGAADADLAEQANEFVVNLEEADAGDGN